MFQRSLLVLAVCLVSFLYAQPPAWVTLMQDPDARFAQTMAEFEAYWENRPITKGSGYKPFQRWAYYMETRLAPDGTQSGPLNTLAEFQAYASRRGRDQLTDGDWQSVGPVTLPANGTSQPNGLGRINAIAFHPTDANTLYVGSPSGGLWFSMDYGNNWAELNNDLIRLGVSAVLVHPTNPSLMYIGTGDRDGGDAPGYGVWRSLDGGNSWAARNTGMGNVTVGELWMDPANTNLLVAATSDGMYRSTNGGSSWTQALSGHNIKDMAARPGDSDTLYASGSNLYRSLNNGQTWTQLTAGVPAGVSRIGLAVSADNPDYVYLLAGTGAGLDGVYRSTNGGNTFTLQASSPNLFGYDTFGGTGSQAWYDLVLIADPNDADHLYSGAINVWESFDGGVNWSIVTHWVGSGGIPAIHADDHALEYSPHTGDLMLGHDGGISYTTNGGASWIDISNGLDIAQVYKLGQSQNSRNLTINGYQDNGTAYYRNGAWITEIGGDGMECIIDFQDDQVMYGALYYGDIRRSTNGGNSFSTVAENGVNGITESGAWVTPYKLDPANANRMYVGYRNIWVSNNVKTAATGSVAWNQISTFPGTNTIRDLDIARSNPDVIYVSRSGTLNFYKTTNATAATPTWTDLDANLPASGFPKDIEIHPTDPNTVWIALGNNIYQSTNGGASWTDVSGTLPNISLNTIVYDRLSPVGAMYVGMDVGVYYHDNTMADWELYMNGLPNVEITELEIYYDPLCRGNDLLRASTYGRGMWQSELKDPGNVVPVACLTPRTESFCTGQGVKLEAAAAYNPTAWTWTITPNTYTLLNGSTLNDETPEVAFTATGSYDLSLTVSNANGSDNTVLANAIDIGGTVASLPLTLDFEGDGLCGTGTDCGATVCAIGNGWVNLTNGSEDDIDWRVDENGTPSGGTGPSVDANPGTAAGNYVYLEASGSCSDQTAILQSPCIDLAGASAVSFKYHMFGGNMGSLHLDVFADGVWNQDVMAAISGDQGDIWQTQMVDLSLFSGQIIKLRFRGVTGNGFESDMALDDISVSNVLSADQPELVGQMLPNGWARLQWEAATDYEAERFVLERSVAGEPFAAIWESRAGQLPRLQAYDQAPAPGSNFYRLQQTDAQGQVLFSNVVELRALPQSAWQLGEPHPNPFTQQTSIALRLDEAMPVRAVLLNSLGQEVMLIAQGNLAAGDHQWQINGANLSAGMYLLRVYTPQGVQLRRLRLVE